MATTVVGVPAKDAASLPAALASLTAQTASDYVVFVLDVSDGDDVAEVAHDSGVPYQRGDTRAGLVADWRACFHVARASYPQARYFAWGSDHDAWEPGWLEALRAELDRNARAVAAFPFVEHVDEDGRIVRRSRPFAARERSRTVRFVRTLRRMVAGDMVYGLFRVDALERCGVYRDVLLPDRLLFAELALEGELVQVPHVLWHRRVETQLEPTLARQRRTLFDEPPRSARLPWWLAHAAELSRARRPLAAISYAILAPGFALARRVVRR